KLLKCVYEKTLFMESSLVSSLLTNESVKVKLEEEIASEAKVPRDDVFIDSPSLPSVSYRYSSGSEVMDIPCFKRDENGRKIPQRLTVLSRLLDMMRNVMNLVRVYSREEYRKPVAKAAERIFGKPTISEMVSY
ncbi:MAG: hypothetical protein QXM01_01460, partial [Candidatus Bathyarchaeia archaeon]